MREIVRRAVWMTATPGAMFLQPCVTSTVNVTTVLALVHDANEETHVREFALAPAHELLERWL